MYTIDLVTIVKLLREFQRSGILRTEISAGLPRFKQPCLVVIELLRGEVLACYVKDSKGQTLLADQEAFQAVSAVGKLNWVFEALPMEGLPSGQKPTGAQPAIAPPSSPRQAGMSTTSPNLPVQRPSRQLMRVSPVPRIVRSVSQAEVNTWSRRHWQVFLLIDGVRDVDKIASMLAQPPRVIEELLRDLQIARVIVLG